MPPLITVIVMNEAQSPVYTRAQLLGVPIWNSPAPVPVFVWVTVTTWFGTVVVIFAQ